MRTERVAGEVVASVHRRLARHLPLLLEEVVVNAVGPLADGSDVEPQIVGHFGSGGDGEGVPLGLGDVGNLDVNEVAGGKVEVGRPFDDQVDDSRGQKGSLCDVSVAVGAEAPDDADDHFDAVQGARKGEPEPELGRVEDEDDVKENVQLVEVVKDFEVAGATHERQGSKYHN